jgi:3-oxoacyl-[acyl-carrier protein] reductase
VAALGGVDLLVANVGGSAGAREFATTTREDWLRTYDLNVGHAIEALRSCIEPMAACGGGSVVFISSISGLKPARPGQYGAAKAALNYAASSLASELGPQRIRVNAIAPGSILFSGGAWDAVRDAEPARFRAFESGEFPFGRLGAPDEVARVVVFVLSDAARWINGATICVDGGQIAPNMSVDRSAHQ